MRGQKGEMKREKEKVPIDKKKVKALVHLEKKKKSIKIICKYEGTASVGDKRR